MSTKSAKDVQFFVNERAGAVSGLLNRPSTATALLVLAHGAGAGMRHRFMEEVAAKLAARDIATLRYQFPYMEKRTKRPDSEVVLLETVRAAVTNAKKHAGDLPIFAGGKSMGGRMTSLAAAQEPLDGVRGLVYFGFPLHAAAGRARSAANISPKSDCRCCFYRVRAMLWRISNCSSRCVRSLSAPNCWS